MKSSASLYEFAEFDVQKAYKEYSPLIRRRLVGSVRRFWEYLGRDPHFGDLNPATFQGFAAWLKASDKVTATNNRWLHLLYMVSVAACRAGKLDHELPFIQIGGNGEITRRLSGPRRRPNGAIEGQWTLDEMHQLFTLLEGATGYVGGIPSAQWFGTAIVFILDTGLSLASALTFTWQEVDLEEGRILYQDAKQPFRSPATVKLLQSLKVHGSPRIFPKPSQAAHADKAVYARMTDILIEGGLRRRSYRPFTRLRETGKLFSAGIVTQLAGKVKLIPPDAPDTAPPLRSGPKTNGLRSFTPSRGVPVDPKRERKLRPKMTLREFHCDWMLPIVLVEKHEVSASTKLVYADALQWWELITGNPSLSEVDEFTWNQFSRGLREASYKRSECGEERPLSLSTQAKHCRCIKAILRQAAVKGLCKPLEISISKVETEVKAAFLIEDARKICHWLRTQPTEKIHAKPPRQVFMRRRRHDLAMPPAAWLAFIAAAFYTGFRLSELLAIDWSMLKVTEGGAWLDVPADAVAKTGKPVRKFVHPLLLEALRSIGPGGPGDSIFDHSGSKNLLSSIHKTIQRKAGIPPERILPLHAWRRTHATQMALTPFTDGIKAAQTALNHENSLTTSSHYIGGIVEATAINLLPKLW